MRIDTGIEEDQSWAEICEDRWYVVLNDPHVVIVPCSTIYRDIKVALLLLERVVLATMNRQREHTGVFPEDKSCAITLETRQRIKTDSQFSN